MGAGQKPEADWTPGAGGWNVSAHPGGPLSQISGYSHLAPSAPRSLGLVPPQGHLLGLSEPPHGGPAGLSCLLQEAPPHCPASKTKQNWSEEPTPGFPGGKLNLAAARQRKVCAHDSQTTQGKWHEGLFIRISLWIATPPFRSPLRLCNLCPINTETLPPLEASVSSASEEPLCLHRASRPSLPGAMRVLSFPLLILCLLFSHLAPGEL